MHGNKLCQRKLMFEYIYVKLINKNELIFSFFPPKLRIMCHCTYEVICMRFPQVHSIHATGTVIFLRFFNPALGNKQDFIYRIFSHVGFLLIVL